MKKGIIVSLPEVTFLKQNEETTLQKYRHIHVHCEGEVSNCSICFTKDGKRNEFVSTSGRVLSQHRPHQEAVHLSQQPGGALPPPFHHHQCSLWFH